MGFQCTRLTVLLVAALCAIVAEVEAAAKAKPWIVTKYYYVTTSTEVPPSTFDFDSTTITDSGVLDVSTITVDPTKTPVASAVATQTSVLSSGHLTLVDVQVPKGVGPTVGIYTSDPQYFVEHTYTLCGGRQTTTEQVRVNVPYQAQGHLNPTLTTTGKFNEKGEFSAYLAPSAVPSAVLASELSSNAFFFCNSYYVATKTASPNQQCTPLPEKNYPDFRCGPSDPCCEKCDPSSGYWECFGSCPKGIHSGEAFRYWDCPADGEEYYVFGKPPPGYGGPPPGKGSSGSSSSKKPNSARGEMVEDSVTRGLLLSLMAFWSILAVLAVL